MHKLFEGMQGFVIFFIIVFLSGIFGLVYGYIKLKNKVLEIEIQRFVFYNYLDLHTLFNAFNKLAALIMTSDKQSAYDFLIAFSNHLKSRLAIEPSLTWTLDKELEFIKAFREASLIVGTEVPEMVSHIKDPYLLVEIPVLSVYSIYRKLIVGRDIQKVYFELTSSNDTIQCTIFVVDEQEIQPLGDHARSSELLHLYNKYYGSRLSVKFSGKSGKAEMIWKGSFIP